MECPVCLESITTDSGKAELSCSHTFHIKCLSTWFAKTETCPCCRHEANTMEKIYKEDEESESIADSDYDDRSFYQRASLEELLKLAAQERARHLFAKLKFLNPAYEVELYSVRCIQAFYRNYRIHKDYSEIRELSRGKKELIKNLATINDTYKSKQKAFSEKYITSYTPQQTTQLQQQ